MKNLKAMFLGLCLLSVIPAQNSKAAMTFTASGAASYKAYELMMLPLGIGGYMLSRDYGGCKLFLCVDKAFAVASLSVGLFFLDEESGVPSFTEISSERASKLGLSQIERISFNDSLEEVNMIKNEMILELATLEQPSLVDANRMWEESRDLLDTETFSALEKIRNSLASFRK